LPPIFQQNAVTLPTPNAFSPACQDLILKLLQRNPKERMTFADFFQHPFIDLPLDVLPPLLARLERFDEADEETPQVSFFILPVFSLLDSTSRLFFFLLLFAISIFNNLTLSWCLCVAMRPRAGSRFSSSGSSLHGRHF
jgi:hypothetical protein